MRRMRRGKTTGRPCASSMPCWTESTIRSPRCPAAPRSSTSASRVASWTGFYRVVALGCCASALIRGRSDVSKFPSTAAFAAPPRESARRRSSPTWISFRGTSLRRRARSEIVIPIYDAADELVAVLDVDSHQPAAFDEIDREGLTCLAGTSARQPRRRPRGLPALASPPARAGGRDRKPSGARCPGGRRLRRDCRRSPRSPARSGRGGKTRPAGDRNRPRARRPRTAAVRAIDPDRLSCRRARRRRRARLEPAHAPRQGCESRRARASRVRCAGGRCRAARNRSAIRRMSSPRSRSGGSSTQPTRKRK